jgi:hypothetical protein
VSWLLRVCCVCCHCCMPAHGKALRRCCKAEMRLVARPRVSAWQELLVIFSVVTCLQARVPCMCVRRQVACTCDGAMHVCRWPSEVPLANAPMLHYRGAGSQPLSAPCNVLICCPHCFTSCCSPFLLISCPAVAASGTNFVPATRWAATLAVT